MRLRPSKKTGFSLTPSLAFLLCLLVFTTFWSYQTIRRELTRFSLQTPSMSMPKLYLTAKKWGPALSSRAPLIRINSSGAWI